MDYINFNPCYGCEDRTMTCHDDCEKYELARELYKEKNKKENDVYLAYKKERIEEGRRHNHKKRK